MRTYTHTQVRYTGNCPVISHLLCYVTNVNLLKASFCPQSVEAVNNAAFSDALALASACWSTPTDRHTHLLTLKHSFYHPSILGMLLLSAVTRRNPQKRTYFPVFGLCGAAGCIQQGFHFCCLSRLFLRWKSPVNDRHRPHAGSVSLQPFGLFLGWWLTFSRTVTQNSECTRAASEMSRSEG